QNWRGSTEGAEGRWQDYILYRHTPFFLKAVL
ncbi:unnamed protein product, partial [marine sediment metagenome]